MNESKDPRIVYGAQCTWWDSVANVGLTPPLGENGGRLPCCPHCGSILFEIPNEEAWWKNAHLYEDDGHPGYCDMLTWSRGKCFMTLGALRMAYAKRNKSTR
jgi:hypothetical protein